MKSVNEILKLIFQVESNVCNVKIISPKSQFIQYLNCVGADVFFIFLWSFWPIATKRAYFIEEGVMSLVWTKLGVDDDDDGPGSPLEKKVMIQKIY